MGTRADFYVGRGEKAEWIGSIAMDGYPDGHPEQCLPCTAEDGFRKNVAEIIASVKHGTTVDRGWPWPWEDSRTTDYAYAFDGGKVWISCFGRKWQTSAEPDNEGEDPGEKVVFPNMKDRQNVTFGERFGLLIVCASGVQKGLK